MDADARLRRLSGHLVATTAAASSRPDYIVNMGEHAWLLPGDPRADEVFGAGHPVHEGLLGRTVDCSKEFLEYEMDKYKVDKTVIITGMWHYLNDNRYTSYCVKFAPDRFAGIGLLVGKHMHAPDDPANPARLEKLVRDDGLCGIRLSPLCATPPHPLHRLPRAAS